MNGGRWFATSLVAFGVGLSLFTAKEAEAFCGFYVSGADTTLFNEATQVALMREGTRTVLAMQNDYKGPPEDFALVIPVPVVLQKENVKTLSKDVFAHLDKLTAPRLVEYWEQNPCGIGLGGLGTIGHGAGTGTGQGFGAGHGRLSDDSTVTVEAQFEVGEYEVLILSARDSTGLDTWLREHQYKIPAGAAEVLKPYVESGSKFFVAKVDVGKLKLENGRAALSPLRFHYDTEKFELPVKLGLLNSSGTQDLIVYVLGRERYEVANYSNVTIPTNLEVSELARSSFGPFYTSLYDRTVQQNPNAVVTEYSWQATACDPCPDDSPGMTAPDLMSLGADVMSGITVKAGSGPRANPPALRMLPPEVSPGLPSEVVHRIVRQSFGRFRLCYENGLLTNPSLGGTVKVKFDIAADGSTTPAVDSGSDLPDKNVIDCIAKGFSKIAFPAPDSKKVTVTYSIKLSPSDLPEAGAPLPPRPASVNVPLVLTRLHARYTKSSLGADLVFRVAPSISGGREAWKDGKLETGATPITGTSSFQARYAIRHPWAGPIECKEPQRGVWGGPWPDAGAAPTTKSAEKLGLQPHGGMPLESFTKATGADISATVLAKAEPDAGPSTDGDKYQKDAISEKSKCGCKTIGSPEEPNPFGVLLLGMLATATAARRRARPA